MTEAKAVAKAAVAQGQLEVNGPLPADFSARFAAGVAEATGCAPEDVKFLGAVPAKGAPAGVDAVVFETRSDVLASVKSQAADPDSKLANGPLHMFLVAKDDDDDDDDDDSKAAPAPTKAGDEGHPAPSGGEEAAGKAPEIDTAEMPFGDLEPFGREDTAQELTESSLKESDAMVDQLERAEVAEEKRAVFRALTRLRGAAITSYDGIARAQTGNLDEYARKNQWRKQHPVHHLAQEESDTERWAFPGL